METKAFTLQTKAVNEDQGRATFVASVFGNVDHSNDRVFKGFFSDSLAARMPKFVADHDWSVKSRLGRVLSAKETDEGLEVEVEFNLDKQVAREVYSDFKKYPEDQEFSFGFTVTEFKPNQFGGRDLLKGEVLEVSPVLIGDNPSTRLVDVKGKATAEAEAPAAEAEAESEALSDGEQAVVSEALTAYREQLQAAHDSFIERILRTA